MTLLSSKYNNKVMDQPSVMAIRYVTGAFKPRAGYVVDYNAANTVQGKAFTIYYKARLRMR